jgi:predicted Zn-dependent protease
MASARRLPFLIAVATLATGCATNPATGERELSLVSESQEIAMGRQAAQQVQQSIGLVDDADLQRYVQQVGGRLAAASQRPGLPWTFGVVDDPVPNAFALPGGFIYITRGMMNLLTNEAELASVIGHEIAHVTARHSVSQISRAQLAQLGFGLGGILFPKVQQLSPLIGAGLDLLFLKYGRDDEREADTLGFDYVRMEGYDVREFPDVFATLQRTSEESERGLPAWLSTHPTSVERVDAAEALVAKTGVPTNALVAREAYLRQIDGLVYGENPRHGFFQEGVFYHPDLRLQVRFPSGWQAQNLTQAVVAVSPDNSAALELTIAPADGARRALDAFASQPGVQLGAVGQQSFHGRPAMTARFRGATQGGALDGYVAFIEHGGRTYQMTGYAAVPAFPSYEATLVRAIQSFAPVTDQRILSVQPQRIDVVEIGQRQTVAEFARRFSSRVPAEELAVLNDVANPSAPIPAGTLMKRVV